MTYELENSGKQVGNQYMFELYRVGWFGRATFPDRIVWATDMDDAEAKVRHCEITRRFTVDDYGHG